MNLKSHVYPISRQPLLVISGFKWRMNGDQCVYEHPHLKTNGTTVSGF